MATPNIATLTPDTNIVVNVKPIKNNAPTVARIDVTLEVMLVVRADVFTVHINCDTTRRLADKQNITNITQKSQWPK